MNTLSRKALHCAVGAAALGVAPAFARGQSDQDQKVKQQAYDERLKALEDKVNAPDTLRAFWKSGLKLESTDKNFFFAIGGRIHFDAAFNDTDSDLEDTKVYTAPGTPGGAIGGQSNGFEIRRARINLNGKFYQHIEFVDQFDFAGGGNGGNGVQQKDVYLGFYNLGDWLPDVRVGQFYEPFGLDAMTSDNDFPMVEFAAPTNTFVPGRSPGFMLRKNWKDEKKVERITGALGVFRPDTGDNGIGAKGTGGYAFTARLTGLPWYDEGNLVHLGLAASERSIAAAPTNGTSSATPTVTYSSNPEQHLMSTMISTGAIPAESELKIGAEAAYIRGRFSIQGEYMIDKVKVAGSSTLDDPTFSGYYAQVAYTLSGERRAWKGADAVFGTISPSKNAFVNGGMGAWELAVRYSNVDLTDGSVGTGVAAGSIDIITLGLNWYANNNCRVMCDLSRADVNTDDPALGKGGVSNIVQLRFQVNF